MNNLKYIVIMLCFALSGCVQNQTRLSSPLQVSEFNSIASQYYPRPTFVALNTHSSGEQSLLVSMDKYGKNEYGLLSSMSFGEKNIDSYLSMIDKYLEWEQIAMERGDQIDKKIGNASDGTGFITLYFGLYSGNSVSHYLVISDCDLICADNSSHHYYTKRNALELKQLLIKLKQKQLTQTDIDNVYK